MARRERIAILTSSYPARPGDPSGHFVQAEARALSRAGHAVTVFAGGDPAPGASELDEVRVPDGGATGWPGIVPRLTARPTRIVGLSRFVLGLRRELGRRGPFERVIAHFLLPCAFPALYGKDLAGAALDVVVHGSDARLLGRLPRPLSRAILRDLLERGASIRCVSSELVRRLELAYGASLADRVRVAPAALDLDGVPTRGVARASLGIAADAVFVVVVGRLLPSKRARSALRAATLLEEAQVVVVGDGPELAELRREFPAVRFAGHVTRPEALTWIAAADALISASKLEGAPSVVREARALGVPVVAAASGDLSTWAEHDPELYVLES